MPVVPPSWPAVVPVRSRTGVDTTAPALVMTRRRPCCSVKNKRPSGANARDQGPSKCEATTSILRSLSAAGGVDVLPPEPPLPEPPLPELPVPPELDPVEVPAQPERYSNIKQQLMSAIRRKKKRHIVDS